MSLKEENDNEIEAIEATSEKLYEVSKGKFNQNRTRNIGF